MSEDTKEKSTPESLSSSDELRDEDLQKAAGAGGDWFVADSFSFGVEREMKESGEKGGTEEMNIGVGELQECTISKSMEQKVSDLKR